MQQYERAVECFTKAIELDDQNDVCRKSFFLMCPLNAIVVFFFSTVVAMNFNK